MMFNFRHLVLLLLIGAAINVFFMTSLGVPTPLCLVIAAALTFCFLFESLRRNKNTHDALKHLSWIDFVWLAFWQPKQYLSVFPTIVPLPNTDIQPLDTQVLHRSFQALGFKSAGTVEFLGWKGQTLILYHHPQFPAAGVIDTYGSSTHTDCARLFRVRESGVLDMVANWPESMPYIKCDIPDLHVTHIPGATVETMLKALQETSSPGDKAPAQDHLIHLLERIGYASLKHWHDAGFSMKALTNYSAEQDAASHQLHAKLLVESWEHFHVGLIMRNRHLAGHPWRPCTSREVHRYLAAHADQTPQEFVDQLNRVITARGLTRQCEQLVSNVTAIQNKDFKNLTGLDLCEEILQSAWGRQLMAVNRFDHPVQAILLKLE